MTLQVNILQLFIYLHIFSALFYYANEKRSRTNLHHIFNHICADRCTNTFLCGLALVREVSCVFCSFRIKVGIKLGLCILQNLG